MSSPPDWQIGPPRRRHRTLWSDIGGLWRRFRGLPILVQLIISVLVIVLVIDVLSILFGSDGSTKVASRSTTTLVTSSTSTTTTILPGLPAGDDTTVKDVLDGDSFTVADGTKIRLIGIDAPDLETTSCYSSEATAHLKELLPEGRAVRLAYDTQRTDRFGRTLAYVFRLPDGLFINLAMVRDGYAVQVTTGPNTTFGREIGDAEADAKNAKRGLWTACPTTTTTARSTATTAARATTTTTEPPTTTTSAPSTSSSSAPSSVP